MPGQSKTRSAHPHPTAIAWGRRHVASALWIAGAGLLLAAVLEAQDADRDADLIAGTDNRAAVMKILPLLGTVAGKTEVEALTIEPDIFRIVFELDGEEVAVRKRPPFTAAIPFAKPAREQKLRAVAYGQRDRKLGEDEIVVNRFDPPLRARITRLDLGAGSVALEATVSVPRHAALESVAAFVGERSLGLLEGPPFGAELPIGEAGPGTVVRVEATLVDGRRVDDAAVVGDALSEELEVNLVQLQAVVTSRDGRPLSGLTKEDFEIVQGGASQQIDRFYLADDVALSIALVVDSSGSMAPIWQRAVAASHEFLSAVLLARDRALLVDFNDRLRLAHELTDDADALTASLAEVVPDGGTALYDSLLFSLLQLTDVPGRRAVVVMTDGADFGSQSKPASVVELGRKLGIPIYIVELPSGGGGQAAALARGGVGAVGAVADLRLLAEPTGGRVFRVAAGGGLGRALGQINQELRNQYVLTYYTEKLPDDPRKSVDVRIRGQKGIRVRTTLPLDQVN